MMPQQQMFTPSVTECDSPVHNECAMAYRTWYISFDSSSSCRVCIAPACPVASSQVKSGGKILRRWKVWSLGRGCALPSWWSGGLPRRKKNQFCAKKLCNSEQVLVLLSYITAESWGGDYPPSPESGDLSPCPPPLLRRLCDCHYVTSGDSVHLCELHPEDVDEDQPAEHSGSRNASKKRRNAN